MGDRRPQLPTPPLHDCGHQLSILVSLLRRAAWPLGHNPRQKIFDLSNDAWQPALSLPALTRRV